MVSSPLDSPGSDPVNIVSVTASIEYVGVWACNTVNTCGDQCWFSQAPEDYQPAEVCNIQAKIANASNWTQPSYLLTPDAEMCPNVTELSSVPMSDMIVDYCLAQPVEEQCNIMFSTPIMIAVVVCNVLKLACLVVAIRLSELTPLLTIGDAIESFLEVPDTTTTGMGPISKTGVQKHLRSTSTGPSYVAIGRREGSTPWSGNRARWHAAASLARWITACTLFTLTWASALILLMLGAQTLRDRASESLPSAISTFGIGKANPNSKVYVNISSVAGNILLVNTPQLLVSLLYVLYNSLFTSMLLSLEWTSYARSRRSLRVTIPSGRQRSSYFLQLPYRYSVTLMIASSLLHWLVSQSIFVVLIIRVSYLNEQFEVSDRAMEPPISEWSPLGLVLTLSLSGSMLCVLWGSAVFRRYDGSMPLAGSCSMAISAACHAKPGAKDEARGLLQYGSTVIGGQEGSIRHACFSTREVEPLRPGIVYQ